MRPLSDGRQAPEESAGSMCLAPQAAIRPVGDTLVADNRFVKM
jgi:hypothetical protein